MASCKDTTTRIQEDGLRYTSKAPGSPFSPRPGAFSGATNTIVTARAGKDILSSLVSGLLTIGPRFGGAIDGAARTWYESAQKETPEDLISRMKKSGNPIQ